MNQEEFRKLKAGDKVVVVVGEGWGVPVGEVLTVVGNYIKDFDEGKVFDKITCAHMSFADNFEIYKASGESSTEQPLTEHGEIGKLYVVTRSSPLHHLKKGDVVRRVKGLKDSEFCVLYVACNTPTDFCEETLRRAGAKDWSYLFPADIRKFKGKSRVYVVTADDNPTFKKGTLVRRVKTTQDDEISKSFVAVEVDELVDQRELALDYNSELWNQWAFLQPAEVKKLK